MIWTLYVELNFGLYAEEPWRAALEVEASSTLEDLHNAIQAAVGFDNDHLYAFFTARTPTSSQRTWLSDPEDDSGLDAPLETIFPLEPRKTLYYEFDFGDRWLFKITRARTRPFAPTPGVTYPRVVRSSGNPPQQYRYYD